MMANITVLQLKAKYGKYLVRIMCFSKRKCTKIGIRPYAQWSKHQGKKLE